MNCVLSALVALAIAVAPPAHAAVVSGGASGTAASAAAGQTMAPQGDMVVRAAQNSTAQSVPISQTRVDALHCLGEDSFSAPVEGMHILVQDFCNASAGKTAQAPWGSIDTVGHVPTYVRARKYVVPVAMHISPGTTNCNVIVQPDVCKEQMGRIFDACGEYGGDLNVPSLCEYFAVYPEGPPERV
ncbi:hypothetical protein C8R47DRAFT_654787 [Mycena vitilis]|nr:hypothetical protein C8R47DRAFT_654787 [Mycena vitilis]